MFIVYVRRPAVAGAFYEAEKEDLKKQIEECFLNKNFGPNKIPIVNEKNPRKIFGLILPHAGYIYSGAVAAQGYFQLAQDGKPENFLIIGPNHSGFGAGVAIVKRGFWEMPFGKIEIDNDLSEKILQNSEVIEEDEGAFFSEHSIEVHLPFLQYIYKNFKFVPICMLDQNYETCLEVGNAIASIKDKNFLIIASTDFTHFETNERAYQLDKKAIDAIIKMDAEKFLEIVERFNISMCGYGPVAAMLIAAKKLGAKKCELIKYATSGDISGNKFQVVGYAALKVVK